MKQSEIIKAEIEAIKKEGGNVIRSKETEFEFRIWVSYPKGLTYLPKYWKATEIDFYTRTVRMIIDKSHFIFNS